jgi:hypothetical protein
MQAAESMLVEAPGFEFTDRPDVTYRIRGTDEQAIRATFSSRVLDYFRDHPGWIVEGQGDWLLMTLVVDMKAPVVVVRTGANVKQQGQLPADQLETLVRAAIDTTDMFQSAVSR